MENFNKTLDSLEKKDTALTPDTDSDTGSFGNNDASDVAPEASEGEKLVLHLEGGVEIHIPTAVYESMSQAMVGATPCDMAGAIMGGGATPEPSTGALEADGETEESPDEEDKKDCPFDKEEGSEESESESEGSESETEDSEEKEDDDDDDDEEKKEDNPFTEADVKGGSSFMQAVRNRNKG